MDDKVKILIHYDEDEGITGIDVKIGDQDVSGRVQAKIAQSVANPRVFAGLDFIKNSDGDDVFITDIRASPLGYDRWSGVEGAEDNDFPTSGEFFDSLFDDDGEDEAAHDGGDDDE